MTLWATQTLSQVVLENPWEILKGPPVPPDAFRILIKAPQGFSGQENPTQPPMTRHEQLMVRGGWGMPRICPFPPAANPNPSCFPASRPGQGLLGKSLHSRALQASQEPELLCPPSGAGSQGKFIAFPTSSPPGSPLALPAPSPHLPSPAAPLWTLDVTCAPWRGC